MLEPTVDVNLIHVEQESEKVSHMDGGKEFMELLRIPVPLELYDALNWFGGEHIYLVCVG